MCRRSFLKGVIFIFPIHEPYSRLPIISIPYYNDVVAGIGNRTRRIGHTYTYCSFVTSKNITSDNGRFIDYSKHRIAVTRNVHKRIIKKVFIPVKTIQSCKIGDRIKNIISNIYKSILDIGQILRLSASFISLPAESIAINPYRISIGKVHRCATSIIHCVFRRIKRIVSHIHLKNTFPVSRCRGSRRINETKFIPRFPSVNDTIFDHY